jgi:hypothetical protein
LEKFNFIDTAQPGKKIHRMPKPAPETRPGRGEQWRQMLSARDFVADERINLQEYFVYFKD